MMDRDCRDRAMKALEPAFLHPLVECFYHLVRDPNLIKAEEIRIKIGEMINDKGVGELEGDSGRVFDR